MLAPQIKAINPRDGADCLTTRMLTTNGMKYEKKFEMYRYFRMNAAGSTAECVRACLEDSICRSFNYQKLTKWCYLSITDDKDLEKATDGKWACGQKEDCPSWLKPKPPPAPADCKKYRMLAIDNSALKGGTILETVSLVPNGDTKECLYRCSNNTECFAYNYLKVDKVCILLATQYENMETESNFKWSSGYKWGCRRILAPPPPSYTVSIQSVVVGSNSMTLAIAGTSYPAMQYQAVCVTSGGVCPADVTGGGFRSTALPAPVPFDVAFTSTLSVSGLTTKTLYTCFVQTQETGTVSTVKACSAGVTILTT